MTATTAPTQHDLWRHLYGDTPGYIAVFAGTRPSPDAKKLTGIKEAFYAYPAMAEFAEGWLEQHAAAGKEVYFCVHLLTEKQRRATAAAPVAALWADGDGATIPTDLPPTCIVQSSPDRTQLYWRLTRAIPPAQAEALNRRIAYAIGADKSGWDLTQLLRPIGVGARNHKYDGAPLVHCAHLRDDEFSYYDPDELDRLLPPLPPETDATPHRAQTTAGAVTPGSTGGGDPADETPPFPLTGRALDAWCGRLPAVDADGVLDRSGSVWRLAAELLDAGIAPWALPAVLHQRVPQLGWDKWGNVTLQLKDYARVAGKLAARPRPARAVLEDDPIPATGATAAADCGHAPVLAVQQARIAALEAENADLRARFAGIAAVVEAPPERLRGTEKGVSLALTHGVFSAEDRTPQTDAEAAAFVAPSRAVYLPEIARKAGVSDDLVGKVIKKLTTGPQPVFYRTDRFETRDRVTGAPLPHPKRIIELRPALPTIAETYQAIANLQPAQPNPKHGGARRRCPQHPDADTYTVTYCAACHAAVDGTPPAPPFPQDAGTETPPPSVVAVTLLPQDVGMADAQLPPAAPAPSPHDAGITPEPEALPDGLTRCAVAGCAKRTERSQPGWLCAEHYERRGPENRYCETDRGHRIAPHYYADGRWRCAWCASVAGYADVAGGGR